MNRLKAVLPALFVLFAGCGKDYDTDELVADLKGGDQAASSKAQEKIIEIGDDLSDPLISILRDETQQSKHLLVAETFSRMQAAGTLREYRANKVAGVLGDVVRNKTAPPETRLKITNMLGEFKAPTAVRPLVSVLLSSEGELRKASVSSLKKIGQIAVPHLVAKRDDPDTEDAHKAVLDQALEHVSEGLLESLKSETVEDRIKVAGLQGQIASTSARASVISVLKDEDSRVRLEAVKAIAEEPTGAERNHLATAATDEEGSVAIEAAAALGAAEDPRAVDLLIKCLELDMPTHRMRAIGVLAESSDEKVVAPLGKAMLEDGDVRVKRAAARALEKLGLETAKGVWLTAIEDDEQDGQVMLSCARALGKAGQEAGVKKLVALLDSMEGSVRVPSLAALADVGQPAVPALLECLSEGSLARQASACIALGQIKASETVPQLIEFIGRPLPEPVEPEEDSKILQVAVEAPHVAGVQALASIGDTQALQPIGLHLASKNANLRSAAEDALIRFGQAAEAICLKILAADVSWNIAADDIDTMALAKRVKLQTTAATKGLWEKLPEPVRGMLDDDEKEDEVAEALAEVLNAQLNETGKVEDSFLSSVKISTQIRTFLVGRKLTPRLNRRLLDLAFPEITAHTLSSRNEAIYSLLAKVGTAASLDALEKALSDDEVRLAPRAALSAIKASHSLSERNIEIGERAQQAVSKIIRQQITIDPPSLLEEMRLAGISLLGHSKTPEIRQLLVSEFVQESVPELRVALVKAIENQLDLSRGKRLPEVQILLNILHNDARLLDGLDSTKIQRQALLRLGKMREIRAVPSIIEVLTSKEYGAELRATASLAYRRITGRKYESD
ncbi:MAG: HEAT repeat domain-containing protein [Planctomycetota bacterium]|nr:HEAT repeat domain-containing protein [Planctomycetota bacterium]MDP7252242.1 HEAT repeat domain-containing protein [Planctomycetota bacterium]